MKPDSESDEFSVDPQPLGPSDKTAAGRTVGGHVAGEPAKTNDGNDSQDDQIAEHDEQVAAREQFIDALDLQPSQRPGSLGRLDTYEVLNVIGRGGMGIVARAFDEQLHRNVAIKVMSSRLVTSERARRRFLREARAAASINHPNVVTIHAVSEAAQVPYLVMEYVDGIALHQRIRKDAPMAYEDVVRIGAQIAAGLAAAEQHGVVHRDIKPANIMLEDGIERVKLTDFGLARLLVENSDLTSLGDMVGTPAYMSPEQVDGGELGPQSDLFSLGCVLYAMFRGRSPFHASSLFAAARRVKEFEPPPVSSIDPSVPAKFDRLLAELLAKDPARRPRSARHVADTLTSWSAETRRNSLTDESATSRLPAMPKWAVVAITVCLLTIVGGAGAALWNRPHETPTGSPISISDAMADGELIVGGDSGEFETLLAALASAQPGITIRLQPGRYRGPFELSTPQRLEAIKIIGQEGVILFGPGDAPVVRIEGLANVSIENLRIETRDFQNAINVAGLCPGLTIHNNTFAAQHPQENRVGLIRIDQAGSGTAEAPIEISSCQLDAGGVGLVIGAQDDSEPAVGYLNVYDNTIIAASEDYGIPIVLQGRLSNVNVHHNWLRRGLGGLSVHFQSSQAAERVTFEYNTFSEIVNALFLNQTPAQQGIEIRGNLVVHARAIHSLSGTPADFKPWFSGNQWITNDDAELDWIHPLFEVVPDSVLMSVAPGSENYLRPSEQSPVRVVGREAAAE